MENILSNSDYQNITLYLNKELSGEDKLQFEKELRARPELMEEAKIQKAILGGLKTHARKQNIEKHFPQFSELRTTLQERREIAAPQMTIWKSTGFKYAIAASFVGALIFSSVLVLRNLNSKQSGLSENKNVEKVTSPSNPKDDGKKGSLNNSKDDPKKEQKGDPKGVINPFENQLASNDLIYNDLYSPIGQVRSGVPPELVPAINAYQNKKYQSSLKLLESLDSNGYEEPNLNYLLLYKGLNHLELKEYKKAIEELNKTKASKNIFINEASQWYLTLGYLKIGEMAMVHEQLQIILNDDEGNYYLRALELEKRLNVK